MGVTSEFEFRALFTVLWIIFIANITWVRVRLREWGGKLTFNSWHIAALAVFAPFWFGGIILYIIAPGWIDFLSFPLPGWFRLITVGVTAISIPFIMWGYNTLGRNWVHALEPSKFLKKNGELVTNGPYHYVRNPIYLGCFVFILAMAFVAANWLLLLPSLFIIPVIYSQIPTEEQMLAAKFGAKYRRYMKATPRIIPKLL